MDLFIARKLMDTCNCRPLPGTFRLNIYFSFCGRYVVDRFKATPELANPILSIFVPLITAFSHIRFCKFAL